MAKKRAYPLITDFNDIPAEALVPKDEQPYEIPAHWHWVRLGSVGELISGTGFPKQYQGNSEGKYPFFKVGTLKHASADGTLSNTEHWIDENVRDSLKAKAIPPNSIIFAKIGEAIKLNRRAIITLPSCIDNNMFAFVPTINQTARYVYEWLMGVDLYPLTNSTTTPSLRKSDLEKLPIPLPPLENQQHITRHIRAVKEKSERANETLESSIESLNVTREHLLSYALSGRATAHLGFSDPNSLLASLPASAFVPEDEQPYDIPAHWRWVEIASILLPQQTKRPEGTNFSYIDIDTIDNEKQKIRSPKVIATASAPSRAARAMHAGDTLFSLVRPYLRNIAFVDHIYANSIASTGFYCCTPRGEINPRYLFHYLKSPTLVYLSTTRMRGDNSPSIKLSDFRTLPFPLPPLNEQQYIADWIESSNVRLDAAAELADSAHTQLVAMQAALTRQAFRGAALP